MTEPDPRVLEPGFAPTPFTAAEIQQGCPAGRTVTLRVERPEKPPFTQVVRYHEVDAKGAVYETSRYSDEELVGEPIWRSSTWEELQAHASFPETATEIAQVGLDIPAGRFECRRYTVTDGDHVNTFWFAENLPGMPVKVEMRREGTVTYTMTMIENEPSM